MLKSFYIVLAVFVALQFIPSTENKGKPDGPDDLIVKLKPPQEVAGLLRESCYDCHSDQTRYPWYSKVQPIGWWLADHIDEANGAINFSHFGRLSDARAGRKLDHCLEAMEEGDMPLKSYLWMHPKARLTPEQLAAFKAWATPLIEKAAKATP